MRRSAGSEFPATNKIRSTGKPRSCTWLPCHLLAAVPGCIGLSEPREARQAEIVPRAPAGYQRGTVTGRQCSRRRDSDTARGDRPPGCQACRSRGPLRSIHLTGRAPPRQRPEVGRRRFHCRRGIRFKWMNHRSRRDALPTAPRAGRTRPSTPPAVNNGPELSAPAEEGVSEFRAAARVAPTRTKRQTARRTPVPCSRYRTCIFRRCTTRRFERSRAQAAVDNNAATNSTSSPGSSARRGFLSGLFNNLGLNWTRR